MNRTLTLGILIIGAGIIVMLGKLGVFQTILSWSWPLLVLFMGLLVHMFVMNRKLPSIGYLPATFMIGLSLVFLLCAWFGWRWLGMLWPIIPLSIAVGLYEIAIAERSRSTRMLSIIIGLGSFVLLLMLLFIFMNAYLLAIVLIIVGALIIARRPRLR
jgi:hypothetical protein